MIAKAIEIGKCSQRLRQLRAENGYSLEKLAKKLQEKYNLSISKDSIANYEKDPERAAGMRIEYALCFSELYNVSLDYLLGVSDTRSPDITIQEIIDSTGLSEESVSYLTKNQHKEVDISIAELKQRLQVTPPITEFIDHLIYCIACEDSGLLDDTDQLGMLDYWKHLWLFITLINAQAIRENSSPEQNKQDDSPLSDSELLSFTREHAIFYAARELTEKINDCLEEYIIDRLPISLKIQYYGEDK